MTQALLKNYFRAELEINESALKQIDFSDTKRPLTARETSQLFHKAFTVTYNEPLYFNPNMKEMKAKINGQIPSDKPILFFYYKYNFMEFLEHKIKPVINGKGYD